MNVTNAVGKMCIGCGLCHSEYGVEFKHNDKGYLVLNDTLSLECQRFIEQVCPIMGGAYTDNSHKDIWGERIGIYEGFSNNRDIRKKASSAGIVTTIGLYLLDKGLIDGVIHIGVDEKTVYKTKTIVSYDKKNIIENCGSRYCISSPWYDLKEIIDPDKKYMAVGKPCDITALKHAKERFHLYENIIYLISFFCAGLPSDQANKNLLQELGCNEADCTDLRYRGNGWPGYTTATDKEGKTYKLEYSKAWGGILGRDVHKFCRLCIDGIGLNSDIVCGDLWYLDKDNPDFSEREGRNIIISRTKAGDDLLKQISADGYITCREWNHLEDLKKIQKHQYTRRATMKAKILANKIFFRTVPDYNKKMISEYSKMVPFSERRKVFLGTIKRIIRKKY